MYPGSVTTLPADLVEFLRELELNNDRDWFEANKERYEKSVRKPMESFAEAMIHSMREVYPGLGVAPKDTLFRIYRDVRFGRDKTPYKTHVAMAVGPKGRRDPAAAGFHVRLDPRDLYVGCGYHMLEPEQLKNLRRHIADHVTEFNALVGAPEFVRLFGTIRGERSKQLPAELRPVADRQPLIYNKSFYYGVEYEAETAVCEDLTGFLMMHLRTAMPMNEFLEAGLRR